MNSHASVDPSAPLIGQPVLRREDERLLTGRGMFVDDIKLPGMVHSAVVRSPLAHARIRSIDVAEARRAPGVLMVITHREIEGHAHEMPVSEAWVMPGFERFLEWPIARGKVRFVGEPVAMVVAETRALAEDACELIEVDYEILDAVTNIDDALAETVLLREEAGTNVMCSYTVNRGDVEAAFKDPYYTRREVFRVHRHTGMALETRGFVANWDASAGKLTLWGANKRPWQTRDTLASMLKLAREDVTLVEVDTGGNFGTRGHFYPENLLISYAAMQLGRPVKFIEDRRETIMCANHSREVSAEVEIAVSREGRIDGIRARVFVDQGAYATGGGSVVPAAKTVQFIPGPYDVKNYTCDLKVMATNKTPLGSFRGPGRYEAGFCIERLLDMVARDLGIDAHKLRRDNLIRAEQMPYDCGVMVPYVGESPYDTGDYLETFDRALELIDYEKIRHLNGRLIDGKLHGVAACAYVDSTGMGPFEEARIVIKSPRAVEVYAGSSANGQGIGTVLGQIAADQLGIPLEWISVHVGSTNFVERGHGHGHSRAAVQGGSAVFLTAGKLVRQMLGVAALRYNEAAENLQYRGGVIYRASDNAPLSTFEDFVRFAAQEMGRADALSATARYENSKLTYSYGSQAAHVTVDPETAVVEVVRFLTVEDVGRILNPMIAHGQTIGASLQAISGTFLDEFIYDGNGQLLTGSFADYLVATSTDFPSIEAETLESQPSKTNPLGVKGVGEGAVSTAGAVLANAVCNALQGLGVEIHDLPISVNNLSRLIREAKAGRQRKPGTGAEAKFGIRYDAAI